MKGESSGPGRPDSEFDRLTRRLHELEERNAELERRLVERTTELQAANLELDSFTSAISHDLRAPLRGVSGFASALEEDFGATLDADALGYLRRIQQASTHMDALIDGLVALLRSTRGTPRWETFDLSAVALSILEDLARKEPARRVHWQVAPGLLVRGDVRMLETALNKLLDNAWKFTARSSAPLIRIYPDDTRDERRYCVSDNGAGFNMVYADKLFFPFQRLHRQDEFPGVGLGLAMAQRIIRRHGGEIEARAEPNSGATFCFTLPDEAQQR